MARMPTTSRQTTAATSVVDVRRAGDCVIFGSLEKGVGADNPLDHDDTKGGAGGAAGGAAGGRAHGGTDPTVAPTAANSGANVRSVYGTHGIPDPPSRLTTRWSSRRFN